MSVITTTYSTDNPIVATNWDSLAATDWASLPEYDNTGALTVVIMTIEHTIFWIDNKPVNLRAPLSYLDASKEARAQVCNGLGPAGVGGWLIPDTIYGMSMTEPSNIHDWCYEYGAREGLCQLEADKLFRANMLAMINELPGWGWVKWLRRRRAQKYYSAVRLAGHLHYKRDA